MYTLPTKQVLTKKPAFTSITKKKVAVAWGKEKYPNIDSFSVEQVWWGNCILIEWFIFESVSWLELSVTCCTEFLIHYMHTWDQANHWNLKGVSQTEILESRRCWGSCLDVYFITCMVHKIWLALINEGMAWFKFCMTCSCWKLLKSWSEIPHRNNKKLLTVMSLLHR